MSTDFWMGEGDRLPLVYTTIEDHDGPIDLTGASVTFNARKAGKPTTITGTATVANQLTNIGQVSYAWASGDTQLLGRWWVQWVVTFAGGKLLTAPNGGSDELWVNQFWAGH